MSIYLAYPLIQIIDPHHRYHLAYWQRLDANAQKRSNFENLENTVSPVYSELDWRLDCRHIQSLTSSTPYRVLRSENLLTTEIGVRKSHLLMILSRV
jgi:hypothetical protein